MRNVGSKIIQLLFILLSTTLFTGCIEVAEPESISLSSIYDGPTLGANNSSITRNITGLTDMFTENGACEVGDTLMYSNNNGVSWSTFNIGFLQPGDEVDCSDRNFRLSFYGDFGGSDWSYIFSSGTDADTTIQIKALRNGASTKAAKVIVQYRSLPVQILSYAPMGTSIRVLSTDSQTFSVTAIGTGLSYEWYLNGTIIPGAVSSFYNFDSMSHAGGTYSLEARVSDVNNFTVSNTFTVIRNSPPTIGTLTPANASVFKTNYLNVNNFSALASDVNSDSISYTWQLNGSADAKLSPVFLAGGTQANYSPLPTDLGMHAIQMQASDGFESSTSVWTVNVNAYSNECNNLNPGNICTLVGPAGMQKDTNNDGLIDPVTEPIKMRPNYTHNDGSGNLFISDSENHVIWFHNLSGGPVVRLGRTIEAGKIKILVGNGAGGRTLDLNPLYAYENYKLNGPQQMFYDQTNDFLFIADYYNHRVVRIQSDGQGLRVFGNQATSPNLASTNGNGMLATDHICPFPVGLVSNMSRTLMWVSCTGNGTSNLSSIKEVNISNFNNPSTWTAQIAVGRVNASGALLNGTLDGIGGYGTTTAQVNHPWALALDSYENLYFTSNNSMGTLRVLKRSTSPASYFNPAVSTPTSGNVYTLTGGNGDLPTSSSLNSSTSSFLMRDGRGLTVLEPTPGDIKGFFISISLRSDIVFLNNSNTQSYGGNTIFGSNLIGAPTGNATTDTFTLISHGLQLNQPVYFATLSGGIPLLINTIYYARTIAVNTFQLSSTPGGAAINLTSNTIVTNMFNATSAGIVWGVYNDPGLPSTIVPAINNKLFNPVGLEIIGNSLYAADNLNFAIRKLNIDVPNGAVSTVTGGIGQAYRSATDSIAPEEAPETNLNLVDHLVFDNIFPNGRIVFGDNSSNMFNWTSNESNATPTLGTYNPNFRLRYLDLQTGMVATLAGGGLGNSDNPTETVSSPSMQGIRQITQTPDGNFLLIDRNFLNGANRNCQVRALNLTGSDQMYFGVISLANAITNIFGNYSSGCANSTASPGLTSALNFPEGLTISGTDLYVSEYNRHCIVKLDSSNNTTPAVGLCGTLGDTNGLLANARLRYPKQLLQDPRFPTNFFVVDQSTFATSSIKYVNLSGADCNAGHQCGVNNVDTLDQNINQVLSIIGGYGRAIAYYMDPGSINNDQICYSSSDTLSGVPLVVGETNYGSHNVTCVNRVNGSFSIRVGSANGDIIGSGKQFLNEQEGLPAANARLFVPSGLTFDGDGNLYIAEKGAHIIRKVKRWF